MRLKRYIRACGAYRNYKKLLGSCCSRKECLRVLRAELEALGMKGEAECGWGAAGQGLGCRGRGSRGSSAPGNPSLEKCRALKVQREEAAEVAALDVSNIISGSGEATHTPQGHVGLGLSQTMTVPFLAPRSTTQMHGLEPSHTWGAIPPNPGLRRRAAPPPTPGLVTHAWYHQQ